MKIEKINDNKINIIFNNSYLQERNITLHSFMSNSIESQSIFSDILAKARDELGFITENYKLSIQLFLLNNDTFLITITRFDKEKPKSSRVKVSRKTANSNSILSIYKFNNYENYKSFLSCAENYITEFAEIFTTSKLYQYNDSLFLIFNNNNSTIANILTEFSLPIEYSELLCCKIEECGTVI